jgi:hypothetical protein
VNFTKPGSFCSDAFASAADFCEYSSTPNRLILNVPLVRCALLSLCLTVTLLGTFSFAPKFGTSRQASSVVAPSAGFSGSAEVMATRGVGILAASLVRVTLR